MPTLQHYATHRMMQISKVSIYHGIDVGGMTLPAVVVSVKLATPVVIAAKVVRLSILLVAFKPGPHPAVLNGSGITVLLWKRKPMKIHSINASPPIVPHATPCKHFILYINKYMFNIIISAVVVLL